MGAFAAFCGPALSADASSAALLWFCSKAAAANAGALLAAAARLVSGE
jgi:hypothetical protein